MYSLPIDDQRQLNKDCDSLISFDLSREDFIFEVEKEVSSTGCSTPITLKKPAKVAKSSAKSAKTSREYNILKAMKKAETLFEDTDPPQDSLDDISPPLRKLKVDFHIINDSDSDDSGDEMSEREKALKQELHSLKGTLEEKW